MKKKIIMVMGAGACLLTSCTNAGDPCTKNEECDSGYCISINGSKQCAATCKRDNCASNMECRHVVPADTGSVGICVPENAKACGICETDKDCQVGSFCMPDGAQKYCLSDCGFTKKCATGYACQEAERDGASVGLLCVPETGSCACNAKNIQSQRACYNANNIGTCQGLETCNGQSWIDCTAPTAVEEVCDGLDNDCDGAYDEGADGGPLTQECDANVTGLVNPLPECIGGSQTCNSGSWGECKLKNGFTSKTLPKKEILCNEMDDNCDGQRDEGLLGQGNYCASCSDNCPPGQVIDPTTGAVTDNKGSETRCRANDIVSQSKCLSAKCIFPFFDNDGYLNRGWSSSLNSKEYSKYNATNNGCEVRDNVVTIGGVEMLNNVPERAIDLGTFSTGTIRQCDGYLPMDDPINHSKYFGAEDMNGKFVDDNGNYVYSDPSSYASLTKEQAIEKMQLPSTDKDALRIISTDEKYGELNGPMATDYYKITFGADIDNLDMYMTFDFKNEVSEDTITQAEVEFFDITNVSADDIKNNNLSVCNDDKRCHSFSVGDSADTAAAYIRGNALKGIKKGNVFLVKIFIKENEENAGAGVSLLQGTPYAYHFGFAIQDKHGKSTSPIGVHQCRP